MDKLDFVLQQMLRETAKPVEDLKIDRFLDQIKIQLQQSGNVNCTIFVRARSQIRVNDLSGWALGGRLASQGARFCAQNLE